MNKTTRIIIVVAVIAAAAVAFVARENKTAPPPPGSVGSIVATPATPSAPLPRLVDLGASTCIPCKMMKPVLDDLRTNYAGHFTTEFIDVWQDREAGRQYGVEMIPTQIFYNADGKELFRHVGFYSKEDILAKWQELGVTPAEAGTIENKPSNERTAP